MQSMCHLLASALLLSATALSSQPVPLVDVFIGGQDGYPAYRIPALVTTKRGTLLAFAEARATLRDHAENDIVLKRSTDRGRTWGPLQLIDEDGTNALNNPTAVVVRETGRVLLMYQRYAKGFDEHNAEPGYDNPRVCRTFLTHSDDDGATWSEPREVTRQVKRPTVATSTATGPGIGIQLVRGKHAGRILMPFNQGPYGAWQVYAAFSDDAGKTWRYGDTAPEGTKGFANEVQFVELSDGSVMLNARNQGGDKLRKIAISRDGGETWSPQPETILCSSNRFARPASFAIQATTIPQKMSSSFPIPGRKALARMEPFASVATKAKPGRSRAFFIPAALPITASRPCQTDRWAASSNATA